MYDCKGKVVVVTGAARGIGQAVSVKFAELGATVVLADIQLAPQEETVAKLKRKGLSAYAFQCDVTSDESVAAFATSVLESAGVPDIVYNNAVLVRSGGVLDASPDNIRHELDVNVLGYLRMAQAFLPHMISRGEGWVVNTASPNAFIPPPIVANNLLGYCITKGAEVSMSYCMATSLRPRDIKVSVVFPDLTYTDSVHELKGNASDEFHRGFVNFVTTQSRSADLVAGRIVDKLVSTEGYVVNVSDGFEESLKAWVNQGIEPGFSLPSANL
ncbi:Putative oxidoreductase ephD [Fusarium oxysporum f. sp. cubense race 1]|uniref:Putative oxidoreductase ephD n=1 Tax=Fusarium oxysporum f. sp. cubense (strain race 1) TaxID=1229664 RepID=N4UVI7_FUSC1|nr:Putative oxidoreductase ephD [Fusarium oxysporum f. sp. cubense race 1]